MKVIFVRHGEGAHNVKKLYSTPDFELTDVGKKQAEVAAERLLHLPIDIIIASSFKRTKQTAEIINKRLGKEIIFTDLAVEGKRPKEIAGKSFSDPEVVKIRQQLEENFSNKNWHFSDEENFYDLKQRAEKFIEFLEGVNEENILVISHINFIKMVFLVMMLKEAITPEIYLKAYDFLTLETSGLTICKRINDDKNPYGMGRKTDWELVTWNDHSHLADID